jgi:hypothetical protein
MQFFWMFLINPPRPSNGNEFPASMWERERLRPPNFESLTSREQWEIDKRLGILDWDGRDDRRDL